MNSADIAMNCTASDLLRELCRLSESRWVIDINGQLPLWAIQGCSKARPMRWGTKKALADSRLQHPQLLCFEQKSDKPDLTPAVLEHAVLHAVLEPDPSTGAVAVQPWILEACMRSAFAVVAVPIADPSTKAGSSYLKQIAEQLAQAGHPPALMGFHHLYQLGHGPSSPHAIVLMGRHAVYRPAAPKRVLAIVSTFNDIDIIVDTIEHLWSEGVDVHVIDNWSSDGTYQILEQLRQGRPDRLVGLERYPAEQADEQYDWHGILTRKEAISGQAGYDWYLHYDSDELRVSPWPGVTLAEAISAIDAIGYNAIDHTLIDFRPTVDGFNAKSRAATFFTHFAFNPRPGAFRQIKGWAARTGAVQLTSLGGHAVDFKDRRVFPLKFLLKHYPLRSREQAQRKVFAERLPRFGNERAKLGWHGHYAHYANSPKTEFLWDAAQLATFEPGVFEQEFLLQRLFGLGFARDVERATV